MDNIKNATETGLGKPAYSALNFELSHPNEIAGIAPWDIDFQQIEPGQMSVKLAFFASENLALTTHSMSMATHQRGASPCDWITFGIADPTTTKSWQGCELSQNTLLMFDSADGFESNTTAGHSGQTLSLSRDFLRVLSDTHDFDFGLNDKRSRTITAHTSRATLSGLIDIVNATVHCGPTEDLSALTEKVAFAILHILEDETLGLSKVNPRYRDTVLKLAIECMYAKNGENMSISNLCIDTGISWRTLNRAFRDEFGIGPKTFYNRLRLNRVKFDLLNISERDKIADVANRYDFWHMGQFAKDYRNLFGELPSDTSKRSGQSGRFFYPAPENKIAGT